MNTPTATIRDGWAVVLLVSAALTASCVGLIYHYLGGKFVVTTAAITVAFLGYTLLAWVARYVLNRLPVRFAQATAVAVVGFLIAAFGIVYPRKGAAQEPGRGDDQDDAVNILADHLGSLTSPYGQLTYLDNPISNLAGSAVLGFPFREMLGSSAWINPLIVAVAVAIVWHARGARIAAFVAVTTASSLGFATSYVVGGDYYVTVILLVVAAWWLRTSTPNSWQEYAAAVLLAVVGTTRVHMLILVALVVIIVVARKGAQSIAASVLAVVISAGLGLMWYLPDPAAFTPLGNGTNIAGGTLPTVAMAVVALALAVLAAMKRIDVQHLWLFGAAIIVVQAVTVPAQMYRGAPFALFAVPLLVVAATSHAARGKALEPAT